MPDPRAPKPPLTPTLPEIGAIVHLRCLYRARPDEIVVRRIASTGLALAWRDCRGPVVRIWKAGEAPSLDEARLYYGWEHVTQKWRDHIDARFTRPIHVDRVIIDMGDRGYLALAWVAGSHTRLVSVTPPEPARA